MKVKICGITNIDDALLAEQLGADALGFIFYKRSKRYISPDIAKVISQKLSAFTLKVGVFVNETEDEINRIAATAKLNLIQLHGDEKPEMISKLMLPSIKSFRIEEGFNFSTLEEYPCTNFLFDTFSQNEFGGTGKTFDWNIIPPSLRKRVIIAGGVSEKNVEEIFTKINPYAVEVSSSLEISPGKKDHDKMECFFQIINQLRSK
ncbi:MAG: phosphoribosylanthranilate isomerase [Ignavibacteria bacterium]|nr:phosphoribosylanthranilate isomerase [Ignavibacteria bacterium]